MTRKAGEIEKECNVAVVQVFCYGFIKSILIRRTRQDHDVKQETVQKIVAFIFKVFCTYIFQKGRT